MRRSRNRSEAAAEMHEGRPRCWTVGRDDVCGGSLVETGGAKGRCVRGEGGTGTSREKGLEKEEK